MEVENLEVNSFKMICAYINSSDRMYSGRTPNLRNTALCHSALTTQAVSKVWFFTNS